jgi:hypothetical protein
MISGMTHDEWVSYKKCNDDFKDQYIHDCPDDLISQIYAAKRVKYIQVSTYGLFNTGEDVCNFGVPKFSHPSRIRIRTKIHTRSNARGLVQMSVTCAAQPIISPKNDILKSPFTLDDIDRVPLSLRDIKNDNL